jgi:hypothetical protein
MVNRQIGFLPTRLAGQRLVARTIAFSLQNSAETPSMFAKGCATGRSRKA